MIAQTWWLIHRQLRAQLRQPGAVVVGLVQPMVWLLLFGQLFGDVVALPGFGSGSYVGYLVPGVVAMNAVSANLWTGMTAIDEIERGTLDRFLTTPVNRGAIMNATVVVQAAATVVQSLVIIAVGWAAGARYPGGEVGIAALVLAAVLLGTVFGGLSNVLGMTLRQRESVIGMSIFLLLPLTFLSTAFMATDLMPGWIRAAAAVNPVDWAVSAARGPLSGAGWAGVPVRLGALTVLAAAMAWLPVRTFRGYRRRA